MTGRCGKCAKQLPRKQFLTCTSCNTSYDIDCAGAEKRFFLMNDEHKRRWKCLSCYTSKPHSSGSGITASTPYDEHVTVRNKCVINISTSNSFESLADTSLDDEDDEDYCNTRLNRSCPELSTITADDLQELKQMISSLQSKLAIAEKEIENLLLQNTNLTDKIAERDSKISRLKQVCSSSIKSRKKRKEVFEARSSYVVDQSFEGLNGGNSEEKKMKLTETNQSKKNNIFILGDQQIRGLAIKILEFRYGKYNDVYNVTSIIKPYAQSRDILTSFNVLPESINEDDVIIFSVGSNDRDPYLLYSNLCNFLAKYKNCKCILINVMTNQNLNVKKLNNDLHMLSRKYDNCTFIDINTYKYNDFKTPLQKLTFKINIEIDFMKYKKEFIDVRKGIKKHFEIENSKNLSPNATLNNVLNETLHLHPVTPHNQDTKEANDPQITPQKNQPNSNDLNREEFFR